MTKAEISERVKNVVVEKLSVDASEVTGTANFINDLGADSLDTVELIMELEKEFGISITDEDAHNIQTVNDAIEHIATAVSAE